MQLLPNTIDGGAIRRYWQRRRYSRIDGAYRSRKKMKIIRIGQTPRRAWSWRIKVIIPKLRTAIRSPWKLLTAFKNAYMNSMMKLAGKVGYDQNEGNVFGGKRVPKARVLPVEYSHEKIEDRLVFEIYQILKAQQKLRNASMEVVQ